jgi:hypothetical protein
MAQAARVRDLSGPGGIVTFLRMKTFHLSVAACLLALLLGGCSSIPEQAPAPLGSVTATNTNPAAIIAAAQSVFAQSGYTAGFVNAPEWIAFDKPAGKFGKAMWGGYDQTTTIRVRLTLTPMAGGNDYRLSTHVYSVEDANEAGFEDEHALSGLWSGEFEPMLKRISAQASGAGAR